MRRLDDKAVSEDRRTQVTTQQLARLRKKGRRKERLQGGEGCVFKLVI